MDWGRIVVQGIVFGMPIAVIGLLFVSWLLS